MIQDQYTKFHCILYTENEIKKTVSFIIVLKIINYLEINVTKGQNFIH